MGGDPGGTVSVSSSNACGNSPSASLEVTATICVGMEDPNEGRASLSIFPNPNRGEFTIASARKGTFLLYNSLGQEVQTLRFDASTTAVTVTHLQDGVYFLVGADRKAAAEKIVVNR